ncbi:MAG TPA: tetratricopeptide repeat protein [Planktothrix sp.]|jgi:tetratricopeptide (TPR) repeat protein
MVEDQINSNDWLLLKSAAEDADGKADFGTADKLWTIALQEAERSGSIRCLVESLHHLAEIKIKINNPVTAEQLLKRAVNELRKKFGTDHLEVAIEFDSIGSFYYGHHDYDKCEQYCKQALAIYNKTLRGDDMRIGDLTYKLALVLHGVQKFSEAEPMYRRAIAIKRAHLGEDDPAVRLVVQDFKALLQTPRLGQLAEQVITGTLPVAKDVSSGRHKAVKAPSDTSVKLRSLFSPGSDEEQ